MLDRKECAVPGRKRALMQGSWSLVGERCNFTILERTLPNSVELQVKFSFSFSAINVSESR